MGGGSGEPIGLFLNACSSSKPLIAIHRATTSWWKDQSPNWEAYYSIRCIPQQVLNSAHLREKTQHVRDIIDYKPHITVTNLKSWVIHRLHSEFGKESTVFISHFIHRYSWLSSEPTNTRRRGGVKIISKELE